MSPCGFERPRLALVSGEFPWLAEKLSRRGITPIKTLFDPRLPGPVGYHPDMQACLLKGRVFVLKASPLRDKLSSYGLAAVETEAVPQGRYPGDVLCNGFAWGGWFVGNPKTLDVRIQKAAREYGMKMLPVRQGYASCAAARIDGGAAVTADSGMARRLESAGFEVLRIRPGHIALPGYDTGFFGGCCGKLAPNVLAVTGRLSGHPDGKMIKSFVEGRGVSIWELTDGPLLDVGGILPLA